MDYSARECENCGMHVHPANDVKYHIGMREFHFCNFKCKSDWLSDNMHREHSEHSEPLELQVGYVGHFNE